jgi:hypothetical protein
LAWVVCLVTSHAVVARAEGPTSAPETSPARGSSVHQADAAAQFDAAVSAYKAGEYARAAELFLVADGLAPSVTALSNALAAAKRTQQPLLMARTAQRALSRTGLSDADQRSARSMLAQAEPQLARLELRCEREPCAARVDGVAVATGVQYAEPGTHRVGAVDGAELELHCAAGQRCAATLPAPKAVPPPPAQVARATPEPAAPKAPAPAAAPAASPRWKQRLPLGVMISAGAAALVFGGLSIWQGMAALDAKQDYQPGGGGDWNDDVRAHARRSDAFMVTGIALAGVAAATAIWWVDWDARSRTQLSVLPGGGATLSTRRRF